MKLFRKTARVFDGILGHLLLYITFLGTAWLLKRDGHVKMDLLLTRLNSRVRNSLNIITSLVGAIICLTIACFGAWVTWDTLQMGYKMSTALEPPQFLILFIIPLGTFLLFIQFLRRTHGYLEMWKASLDKEQG